jgi:hypothetical protein
MTYIKNNLPKPGANKGVGGNKKYNITFFDFDDVANFPARDANGIVITGNIQMHPDAYMITVYGTIDTIKNTSGSEGEFDAEGIIQSCIFNHPGNEVAVREFRTNWLSKNIGIIFEHCSDNVKDLYGSPCAPMRMSFKHDEDKDKNTTEFTFKSSNKGPDVADYRGTLTYADYVATIAADATEIDLSSGEGRYFVTGSATAYAEITATTGAVEGMKFTLVGGGGAFPAVINGQFITSVDEFQCKDSIGWNANLGSEITFQAFKRGESSFMFIELSRK